MAENDETSDKNLSTSENTKTCQQIESQNMPESQIIHRYNREEMLKIRENALSRTRPKEFSKEFDNEDGFFSPDKWLQHKWQCEGVENRGGKQRGGKASSNVSGTNAALPAAAGIGTAKLLGAIFEASSNNQNGLDQQMILSPQRRGFSSGCRASSPPSRNNDKDEEKASKSRWRQGHLSNNGMDFKPAFQKSALEANNNGRTSSSRSTSNNVTNNITVGGSGSFSTMLGGSSAAAKQQNWDKDKNRRSIGGGERSRYSTHTGESEQMPEWMNDGPTSHLDIIELKGFDDDNSAGGANNANNSANEKNPKRRRSSKGKEPASGAWVIGTQSKTSNKDGNGGGGGSDEKMKGGGRTVTSSSSTRQKRHSSGDIGAKNNHSHSNSRPTSRNTPSRSNCASRKNSTYSPANPVKFIQASDLESYILMEHQNKLNKEKGTDGKFDLFSTLGIEPPKQQKMKNQEEKSVKKLPNTDAEFAEFIFGVPANQIGGNQKISGAKQEPTSSRLSRFFANNATDENGKQQLNKNSQKSIKEDKLLTKSQFDISALQQALYQQGFGGGRQSSSPLNNILTGPSPHHLRPASTELSQQQQRFSSPIMFRGQQQSPATLNNLMKIGVMPSHNKFLPGMAFGPGPNISPEREALFQQMQTANLPMPTGGLHSQHQHHFSPSPVQQFQQQQQFMMNQFRKPQRTSPPTMQQMPPHALLPPGVGVVHHPPSLPRPSSVEHQFLNSSSPMMFRQQSPQMGMPPFGPNFNNGFAHFPMHIQHLLLDTARRMQPNPNIDPGQEHLRAAFYELINQKEPKLRHYMMQQWQNNPNLNQFGLPFGLGGGGGSFPPMGNPSPFHPSSQMFGPPPPFHPHNQHGIGMHHGGGGGGGQFGFPPPPGGGPVPVPTIPPHVPQQFGGGPPPPPYFHPSNQFAANMNPPPPQQFSQLPPNAVNHHQKQPPQPNNPTNLLNSTFFMPTSVMRQMSKMPSGSGGGSNNGGGGDSFVDLGPNSANNNSSIFLQKLLGGGETATNLVKSGGRAILGRDPDEDGGGLPSGNVPRISGCLKLEDIEQRELAALQQQQSSSTSSSSRNPPTISSSNNNANAPITADPPTAAKQQNTANAANFL